MRISVTTFGAGALAWAFAFAFTPTPVLAQAQQTMPIRGQDALGDPQTGPDGYSQAPVPRTQTPSGKSPGGDRPGKSSEDVARNVPDATIGKTLPPDKDPQAPAAAEEEPGQNPGKAGCASGTTACK